uniref:MAX gene-associated protein n=1 Tax=Melopsittacus undulatus TaxID=13146 RepID=A0A8V5FRD2_MELUD
MEKQQLVLGSQDSGTVSGAAPAFFVILKQQQGNGKADQGILVANRDACALASSVSAPVKPKVKTCLPADCISGGITVTLDNNTMWNEFYHRNTEMILTKQGRRMFPYCRYWITGLDVSQKYILVMDISPVDNHRYKWNGRWWEPSGKAEPHVLGRVFIHPESPSTGHYWMHQPVSFYKLKLTNNTLDQEGHIILHSMHRYLPRLHLVPADKATEVIQLNGPDVHTFTFPQTEFFAVTAYQNIQITQLKIDYNPFAKGFRDDGLNSRPQRDMKQNSNLDLEGGDIFSAAGIHGRPSDALDLHQRSLDASFIGQNSSDTDMDKDSFNAERDFLGFLDTDLSSGEMPKLKQEVSESPIASSYESSSHVASPLDPNGHFNVVVKEEPIDDYDYELGICTQGVSVKQEEDTDETDEYSNTDDDDPILQKHLMRHDETDGTDGEFRSRKRVLNSPSGVAKAKMLKLDSGKMPVVYLEPCAVTKSTVKISELPQTMLSSCKKDKSPFSAVLDPLPVCFENHKGSCSGTDAVTEELVMKKQSSGNKVSEKYSPVREAQWALSKSPNFNVRGSVSCQFSAKEICGRKRSGILKSRMSLRGSGSNQNTLSSVTTKRGRPRKLRISKAGRPPKGIGKAVITSKNASLGPGNILPDVKPDLEDVDGVLFVSFASKEALDIHTVDKAGGGEESRNLQAPLLTKNDPDSQARIQVLEKELMEELKTLRHKQVIHPSLQEGGSSEASLKNRSAFCSDKLDEYLENEGKLMETSMGFSSSAPASPVVYQLPTKSTSYVRTLDSVLKKQSTTIPSTSYTFKPVPPSSTSRKTKSQNRQASTNKVRTSYKPILPSPFTAKQKQNISVFGEKAAKFASNINVTNQASGFLMSPVDETTLPKQISLRQAPQQQQAARPPGLSKSQVKLMDLEDSALWDGKPRTYITEERADISLATLLTAQASLKNKPIHKIIRRRAPPCNNDFCRLGCICASLAMEKRQPTHCRRPDCMFGCTCLKRKVMLVKGGSKHKRTMKKATRGSVTFYGTQEDQQEDEDGEEEGDGGDELKQKERKKRKRVEYTICDSEPEQPIRNCPLWVKVEGEVDPEPIYIPTPSVIEPVKPVVPPTQEVLPSSKHKSSSGMKTGRVYTPKPNPVIREEDKDPIYLYFESMMTCARVRVYERKKDEKKPEKVKSDSQSPTVKVRSQTVNSIIAETYFNSFSEKSWCSSRSEGDSSSTSYVHHTTPGGPAKLIKIISDCNLDEDHNKILTILSQQIKSKVPKCLRVGSFTIEWASEPKAKDENYPPVYSRMKISVSSCQEKDGKPEISVLKTPGSGEPSCKNPENLKVFEGDPLNKREESLHGVKGLPFYAGISPAGKMIVPLSTVISKVDSTAKAAASGTPSVQVPTTSTPKTTSSTSTTSTPTVTTLKTHVPAQRQIAARPSPGGVFAQFVMNKAGVLQQKVSGVSTCQPVSGPQKFSVKPTPMMAVTPVVSSGLSAAQCTVSPGTTTVTTTSPVIVESISAAASSVTTPGQTRANEPACSPAITVTAVPATSGNDVSTTPSSTTPTATVNIGKATEAVVPAATTSLPKTVETTPAVTCPVVTTSTATVVLTTAVTAASVVTTPTRSAGSVPIILSGVSSSPSLTPKKAINKTSQMIILQHPNGQIVQLVPLQQIRATGAQTSVHPVMFRHPGSVVGIRLPAPFKLPGSPVYPAYSVPPAPNSAARTVIRKLSPMSNLTMQASSLLPSIPRFVSQAGTLTLRIAPTGGSVTNQTASESKITCSSGGLPATPANLIPLQSGSFALLQLPGQKTVPNSILNHFASLQLKKNYRTICKKEELDVAQQEYEKALGLDDAVEYEVTVSDEKQEENELLINQSNNVEESACGTLAPDRNSTPSDEENEAFEEKEDSLTSETVVKAVSTNSEAVCGSSDQSLAAPLDNAHQQKKPIKEEEEDGYTEMKEYYKASSEHSQGQQEQGTQLENKEQNETKLSQSKEECQGDAVQPDMERNNTGSKEAESIEEKSGSKWDISSAKEQDDAAGEERTVSTKEGKANVAGQEGSSNKEQAPFDSQEELKMGHDIVTHVNSSWSKISSIVPPLENKSEVDNKADISEKSDFLTPEEKTQELRHSKMPTLGITADGGEEEEEDDDEEDEKTDDSADEMLDGASDFPSEEEIDVEKVVTHEYSEDDEQVDIETVEELSEKINIARLKATAANIQPSQQKYHARSSSDEKLSENPSKVYKCQSWNRKLKTAAEAFAHYRQTHTANERRRRHEMRDLFEKLKIALGLHSLPKVSKCYILKQAYEEIQGLTDQADKFIGQKNLLMRKQDVLIRKISQLSGKTEEVVLKKLEYIYAKQKAVEAQKKKPVEPEESAVTSTASTQQEETSAASSEPPEVAMTNRRGKPLILARKGVQDTKSPLTLNAASLVMTPQGQVLTLKSPLVPGQVAAVPSTLLQAELNPRAVTTAMTSQPESEDSFMMPKIVNVTSLAAEVSMGENLNSNNNFNIPAAVGAQASEKSVVASVESRKSDSILSEEKAKLCSGDSGGDGRNTTAPTNVFLENKDGFLQLRNVSCTKEPPESFCKKLCLGEFVGSQVRRKDGDPGGERLKPKELPFRKLQIKDSRIEMELRKVASAMEEAELDASELLSSIEESDDTDETLTSLLNEIAFLNQQLNDDASAMSELPSTLNSDFSHEDAEARRGTSGDLTTAGGSSFQFGHLGGSFKDLAEVPDGGGSISPLLLHLEDDDLTDGDKNSGEPSSEADVLKIVIGAEMKDPLPNLAVTSGGNDKTVTALVETTSVTPPVLQMKTNPEASTADALWRPMPKLAPLGLKVASLPVDSEGQSNKVMPLLAPVVAKLAPSGVKSSLPAAVQEGQGNRVMPALAPVVMKLTTTGTLPPNSAGK